MRTDRQPDDTEVIDNLINNMDKRCIVNSELAGKSVKGIWQGWNTTINDVYVTLEGNLNKRSLGNNQEILDYAGVIEALDKLKEETGLPIYDAILQKLDFGPNIVVNQDPKLLLSCLGSAAHCTTHTFPTTKEFRNTQKQISAYDKSAEQRKRKIPLLPAIADCHLARLELRLLNNKIISDKLGVKRATVADLISHYDKIIEVWFKEFESVHKIPSMLSLNPEAFSSVKSLETQLMQIAIQHIGGYERMEEIIKMLKDQCSFKHPSTVSHFKSRVKKIISTPTELVNFDYAREFQASIEEARLFALSELVTIPELDIAA